MSTYISPYYGPDGNVHGGCGGNGGRSISEIWDDLIRNAEQSKTILLWLPKKVIFNPPATIILWADGTKTVVKCKEGEEFDEWVGFITAYAKKAYARDGFAPFGRRQLKNAVRQEKKNAKARD